MTNNSEKIFKSDLDDSYDLNKIYYVGGAEMRLKDLPDDAVVKFKAGGEIDKRTFSSLIERDPKKMGKPTGANKMANIDSPQKLRRMFQSCFSENEVRQLIEKGKVVAIQQGNAKMIMFLIEQLFGKAPQNVSHSGDSENPIEYLKRENIDKMDSEELDEYLNNVIEVYDTEKQRGK